MNFDFPGKLNEPIFFKSQTHTAFWYFTRYWHCNLGSQGFWDSHISARRNYLAIFFRCDRYCHFQLRSKNLVAFLIYINAKKNYVTSNFT